VHSEQKIFPFHGPFIAYFCLYIMHPLVAIVILNWNGKKYLEEFLPFLIQSSYKNYKIIVADNNSTDDSLPFLNSHFPEVQVIKLVENYGFAKGYNLALQQVDAPYYVLLNSDVKVATDWIEPMVALLESDLNIAACQPKLLAFHQPDSFEYAGAAGGWLDHLGYPFAMGRIFDITEKDMGQYDQSIPIFWASGAALCIRAKSFHEVGGFDNYFFAHQEEIDLCWRLQLAGSKVYSCPRSVVYHVGGGTLPKGNSLKTYLNFRNNNIMLFKNLSGWNRFYVLFLRAMLDSASAIKSLVKGDSGYFLSVVRAHISFISWIFSKREGSVFPQKKSGRLNGYYSGSVAWQHFVKGKRKFTDLISLKKTVR